MIIVIHLDKSLKLLQCNLKQDAPPVIHEKAFIDLACPSCCDSRKIQINLVFDSKLTGIQSHEDRVGLSTKRALTFEEEKPTQDLSFDCK